MLRSLTTLIFSVLVSIPAAFAADGDLATPEPLTGWTVWTSLGGNITSDPAACTSGNWTYVVARGTDNFFYYRRRYLPTGIWYNWVRIPGSVAFSGSPAAGCHTYYQPNFWVTGIGKDRVLYINYFYGDHWGAWSQLRTNDAYGTGPSVASVDYPEQRHFFVRGADGSVFHQIGPMQTTWEQLTSPVTADPASVMQNQGHLDLIIRAYDGTLMHRFWENGVWYNFAPVGGGVVTSSPDVVSRGLGSLDLFVRGQGNVMLHKRWINGVWGGWEWLGGAITSGPGATTYASNARMMVFARWSDGQLYYRAWAP